MTVRQLKQLLFNAAEGPMTNPELVAQASRRRDETGVDDERLRIQTQRPEDHR